MSSFCSSLYKLSPALFPSSYETGYLLRAILAGCSVVIVLYCLFKIHQQRRQLQKGSIDQIDFWLLPLYYRFLWCVILIFVLQIIDSALVYVLLDHQIPVYYVVVHDAIFFCSSLWLFDLMLCFLIHRSHGLHHIKRSVYLSTALLVINTILFSIKDIVDHNRTDTLSSVVYAVQCVLCVLIVSRMCYIWYSHYNGILLLFTLSFFVCCFLRFFSESFDENAFCLVDIAEYIENILAPILMIIALKIDSDHWTDVKHRVLVASRDSIASVLTERLSVSTAHYYYDGDPQQPEHQTPFISHRRYVKWTELLSQHTKILNPRRVIELPETHQMIGGSANIVKAKYNGELIAIKAWKFGEFSRKIIALWCKEVLISATLLHRNIVALKGVLIEPPTIKIVMEYCRYGSLHDMLLNPLVELSWKEKYAFLLDIANGVRYLHQRGYIYRDLKSLNLLVDVNEYSADVPYMIKLCDFGSTALFDADDDDETGAAQHLALPTQQQVASLSAGQLVERDQTDEKSELSFNVSHRDRELSTVVGSVPYLPPEILKNLDYTKKTSDADSLQLCVKQMKSKYGKTADTFSFGLIMWEIITRRPLYANLSQRDIRTNVVKHDVRPMILENDLLNCPNATLLVSLMEQCWNKNPQKRPSFSRILATLNGHKAEFLDAGRDIAKEADNKFVRRGGIIMEEINVESADESE